MHIYRHTRKISQRFDRRIVFCNMVAALLMLWLLGCPMSVVAKDGDPGKVKVQLNIPQKAWLMGLPLPITVVVENPKGNGTVRVPSLEFSGPRSDNASVGVMVRRKGDREFREIPYVEGPFGYTKEHPSKPLTRENLDSGQQMAATDLLSWGWEFFDPPSKMVFPSPGQYELRVSYFPKIEKRSGQGNEDYFNNNFWIDSDVVEIEIVEAADELDQKAWENLSKVSGVWLLGAPQSMSPQHDLPQDTLEQLRGWLKAYSKSQYAPWVEVCITYADYVDARKNKDSVRMEDRLKKIRELASGKSPSASAMAKLLLTRIEKKER